MPENYKKIREMRDQRYKLREIAAVFGVTHQAISYILKRGEPKIKEDRKSTFLGTIEGRDRNREKARIRDDHTCQDCGIKRVSGEGKRSLDVHHLNGLCGKKSRGYDKEIEGLVTLCHKCHFNRPEHAFKRSI